MTDTDHLLATVAAAKFMTATVKAADTAARAELLEHLRPGERRIATTPSGADIGAITRTKVTETATPYVTDPAALVAWLKETGRADAVEHVPATERPAPWFTAPANLTAQIEAMGGELPPGVDIAVKTSGGHLTVAKQTTEQVAAILAERDVLTSVLTDRKEIQP